MLGKTGLFDLTQKLSEVGHGRGALSTSHIPHPTNLLLAGEDFGDVERVVVDAAIGAEHVGYDEAE